MRFAVRLITTVYALRQTRYTPLFCLYFMVYFGDTVAEEIVWQTFGDGIAYLWAYGIGSTLLCLFALWITMDNVRGARRLRKCAVPGVLAVVAWRVVELESHTGLDSGKRLILTVGAFLLFCGIVTTAAATYAKSNHISLYFFGILWLAQAAYFFAYLIQGPEMKATGYWAPAFICAALFLAIGWTIPDPVGVKM